MPWLGRARFLGGFPTVGNPVLGVMRPCHEWQSLFVTPGEMPRARGGLRSAARPCLDPFHVEPFGPPMIQSIQDELGCN